MYNMRASHLLLILLTVAFLSSCGTQRKVPKKIPKEREIVRPPVKETPVIVEEVKEVKETRPPTTVVTPPANSSYEEVVQIYIQNFKEVAKEEMLLYGIPASIKIAQGILESGAGRGSLTSRSNNHFGIKCHVGWTGESVRHDDDELQECFRKYNDPRYSFRDHSLFLTSRPRYSDLFSLKKDDYKGWARGLRQAGYATDPKYPEKLINIIERYELYKLDQEVLGNEASVARPDSSKVNTYTVRAGDTLFSIGRRFNIPVETLKQYNGLASNDIQVGQILYLNPRN
jgi:flagellum-specific peptidoglycan hydrolase FlgJ